MELTNEVYKEMKTHSRDLIATPLDSFYEDDMVERYVEMKNAQNGKISQRYLNHIAKWIRPIAFKIKQQNLSENFYRNFTQECIQII